MKVVIKDIDQTKLEKSNIFGDETISERIMELSDYLEISKKCIAHFASNDLAKQMLRSEDAVSFVAEHLMMGTCRWKPNRGKTVRSYHNQCAIWAIQNWISRISKKGVDILSLNKDLSDSEGNQLYEILEDDRKIPPSSIELEENAAEVDRILSDRTISEKEEKCIRMKFLDQLSVAEISESLGISKKMVYTNVQRGLKKLRKKHNES